MDIGRVQPSGIGLESHGVHGVTQPESREDATERRHLIQAVKALNATEMFGHDSELTFVIDRHTRKAVVRVIDSKTREVIMQVPTEQVLRMAREHSESRL